MSAEWDALLASLAPDERARAERLLERFRLLGCDDPEGWTRSEIRENFAQLARFCLLRVIWRDAINPWRDRPDWIARHIAWDSGDSGSSYYAGPALKRMRDAGIDPVDIRSVARAVAWHTAFDVVHAIDQGSDPYLSTNEDYPGWFLQETDAEGNYTGRDVGSLHESIGDEAAFDQRQSG